MSRDEDLPYEPAAETCGEFAPMGGNEVSRPGRVLVGVFEPVFVFVFVFEFV